MKLRTLKPSMRQLSAGVRRAPTLSDQRMAGHKLQKRRLRLWTANPCCAMCGRFTDWPRGFELDHTVRLADGGPDEDHNCQVLCVWWDEAGRKQGCHAAKTAQEGTKELS